MKAHAEAEKQLHSFLNSAVDGGEKLSSCNRPLYPRRESPRCLQNRSLGGPQSRSRSSSRLKPNDPYRGRTATLTSKRCILYIYSTNIGTEYFKHGICSPFFLFKMQFFLIILTYLVPVLFTFYIQGVLKLKK